MMEYLAQAGEGGGHVHHHSPYLPSRTKLWCTIQLRGQIPLFLLYPYMYSVAKTRDNREKHILDICSKRGKQYFSGEGSSVSSEGMILQLGMEQ
jgi:hypothetical protein